MSRRAALLLGVGPGELLLAEGALKRLLNASWRLAPDVYVVDDSTEERIGETLRDILARVGIEAQCVRLPQPLGFRGCVSRTMIGLNAIATSGRPYRYVVKIDPDTLVVRRDLPEELDRLCGESGLWGLRSSMRWSDRALFLSDLLPFGFRRKRRGTMYVRAWSLSRTRPVWWSRMGWAALRGGFRFKFPGGGFYVLGAATLRRAAEVGWLTALDEQRYGFICSEEDVMVTLMTHAVGDPVHDFRCMAPKWGKLNLSPHESLGAALSGVYVLHPVKSLARQADLSARCTVPKDNLDVRSPDH